MNHFEIKVPKLASLILTHELDGEIKGLDEFRDRHPPPLPVFFAFRVMVGMGMLMLATSWLGWWLYRRARWQPERLPRALLWLFAGMTFSGWVATVAGWYVTEIGRQPFIVYGLIRTADVVSTKPTAAMIGLTLDALPRALRAPDRRLRERAQVHGREARGRAAGRRRRRGRHPGRSATDLADRRSMPSRGRTYEAWHRGGACRKPAAFPAPCRQRCRGPGRPRRSRDPGDRPRPEAHVPGSRSSGRWC